MAARLKEVCPLRAFLTSMSLGSCLLVGQAPAPAPESHVDISAGLLRFADSIPNFYQIANVTGSGWAAAADDICSWKYIICSNGSTMLNISYVPLAGKAQWRYCQIAESQL